MTIIPLPSQIEPRNREFRRTAETDILINIPNRWNADYLHSPLATPTGLPLREVESSRIEQWFGTFSIVRPQAKGAD